MTDITYPFSISERILFWEIYFPKRAAYYGAIFDALREGYNEEDVKSYLQEDAAKLLDELQNYPGLLDPRQYEQDVREKRQLTAQDAIDRIAMYKSSFKGWSTYTVDGVFFGEKGKVFEEATQVVRIMLRFVSSPRYEEFQRIAEEKNCEDVLRSILYCVITRLGRLDEETGWGADERERFLKDHSAWTKQKRIFAKKHFVDIAKEAQKWVDDCCLFLFGYLVRKFWQNVVAKQEYEEEIWATSLFSMNLNVIHRISR